MGWNSPKPVAARRFGSIPCEIKNSTTESALAAERSQLELKRPVPDKGTPSVCPSTRKIQSMSSGSFPESSWIITANFSISSRPRRPKRSEPLSNNSSDWNTKRSPTILTSSRLATTSRRRPKNSDLYRANSCTFDARATLRRELNWAISNSLSAETVSEMSRASLSAVICWRRLKIWLFRISILLCASCKTIDCASSDA